MTTESYLNPVLSGFHPDPSICRVGDDYYLVTSTFEYFPGVPIFHSRDLRHWRQLGHVLTRDSQLPLAKAKSSQGIQATGHADLVQASDGAWWLVFLGIRPPDGRHHHLGRETFLAPVAWDEAGWPVVNGNGTVELSAAAAGLPRAEPWPEPSPRDDFDAPALGVVWNFVRNPDPASFSLAARAGWLRLTGTAASLDEVGLPAFVGRRQEHFRCRASTLLEFLPQRASDVAGLVVRANEANHYDLLVTGDGANRDVELRARVRGNSTTLAKLPLAPGPVLLAIDAREDRYEFSVASSGEAARSLGTQPTAPLSSEAAGGFTGVYFGLYASARTSDGASSATPTPTPPADFDWFEYRAGDD